MVVATQDEWIQFVVTSSYISCITRESDVPPARHTFGKVQGYILSLLLLFPFAVLPIPSKFSLVIRPARQQLAMTKE